MGLEDVTFNFLNPESLLWHDMSSLDHSEVI